MPFKQFPLYILLVVSLLLMGGCGTIEDDKGRPIAKKFEVKISNLDWMEISYFPLPSDPVFKMPCKLSLMGSGEVEIRMGSSPQVWNSFSDKVDDPNWNEIYIDRWHAGQDEMQRIYQDFVNEGVVARFPRQAMLREVGLPNIRINARIGKERVIRRVDDPRMVGIVERILRNFDELARRAYASSDDEKADNFEKK